MVFIALNKKCHSNPTDIISKLCQKKDIYMSPKQFVKDVLCKDPEFMTMLKNHGHHGIKTQEW